MILVINYFNNHDFSDESYFIINTLTDRKMEISASVRNSFEDALTYVTNNYKILCNKHHVSPYATQNNFLLYKFNYFTLKELINHFIKSFKKIQNEIMETRMLNITQQQLEKIDIGMYEDILNNLGGFKKWFPSPPGKEHYRLLIHISNMFNNINILDVGTNYGCSALALANNPSNKVISYDIVKHPETEHIKCSNIEFRIGNVLYNEEVIKNSKLIMLDTAHDGTFENEFYNKLKEIQWEGMLLLDDIKLNNAMEQFWKNIHHVKWDLTHLGHFTGTGLVMFSNNG